MARRAIRTEPEWHRKMAVDLFNHTWKLITKRRRTVAENDEMIHAAHGSRFHWGKVGTPQHLAIGEWQISHVYAILRRSEPATYHARRCLQICQQYDIYDFPRAFAFEALARADMVAGRWRDLRHHLARAREAGEGIGEADDRAIFFGDLKTIRARKRR